MSISHLFSDPRLNFSNALEGVYITYNLGRMKVSLSRSCEKLKFYRLSCWPEVTRAASRPHIDFVTSGLAGFHNDQYDTLFYF